MASLPINALGDSSAGGGAASAGATLKGAPRVDWEAANLEWDELQVSSFYVTEASLKHMRVRALA